MYITLCQSTSGLCSEATEYAGHWYSLLEIVKIFA